MSEPHDLTVTEQVAALRSGSISSIELTEHYLQRIARLDDQLGAFVERTEALAHREAELADIGLRQGETRPLLGIPTAYKDLSAVAGVPIHLGSAAVNVVPEADGPVVGRWRDAGAVTLGTTHAPELGPTCFTASARCGKPAVTPYDTSRYASGSSGGAASAVAAGLLPLAHGSDGAGSLRTPAAVCGLVGFKSSRGRVPGSASFLALNVEGALTRTVADAALALSVTWGATQQLYGLPHESGVTLDVERDPQPLRIATWCDSGIDAPTTDVAHAVRATAELLTELGHDVNELCNPVPWTEPLTAGMLTVVTSSVASAARRLGPSEQLAPFTRWCLTAAEQRTATDFVEAQAALAAASNRLLEATSAYDVILTPVASRPAVPIGWFEQDGPGEECGHRMLRWSAYTPWANLTGQAAVSLPSEPTDSGLPVGVQLTASRVGADALLLQLAAQMERAKPFAHRHPPQW